MAGPSTNKSVQFTDRIKTTAWTHASERNVPHLRDFQSTSPVVRTPPTTDSPRAVDRAPSFPQDRKQKQPIVPQPAAPPTVTLNAPQPRSVSFSSSDPPSNTIEKEERGTTLEPKNPKPGIRPRMKAGSFRFAQHTKNAIFHSWINVLLVFVPVGIAVKYIPMPEPTHSTLIFAMNAIAIIPLAGLLAHATEAVASRMGDTWASLLNVTFGNAVELIIFIIALIKDEIAIVQASILGSILANLLLILGMAFLFGGLRYQEQIYNSTVTQMSACLLSLAVMSLLLPTAFHASFSDVNFADRQTTKISRGTSIVLLIVYVLYLLFQLKSHAYMYESTPQEIIDEETLPGFLAEYLDSSSSDDSDTSSSSSDSDSSLGSHTTARKRFRHAISKRMRRKSNASSVQTAAPSVPSVISSPTGDKRSVASIEPGTPQEGYFEMSERQRRESHHTGIPPTFNGTEADDQVGVDPMAPRVRDFETEHRKPKHPDSKHKVKKYKEKIRKYKQQKGDKKKDGRDTGLEQVNEATTPLGLEPQVAFAEPIEPVLDGTADSKQQPPTKRTFTGALPTIPISIPRPPLPSVFTNTVFSQPQAQRHAGMVPPSQPPMQRATTGGLRRTNSLPNIARQAQPVTGHGHMQPNAQPTQRSGTLVINEADAILKDEEEEGNAPTMSRTAAVVLLLCTTGLVAFCAELMVDAIPAMIDGTSVSQAFIGLIILPIVGNAAEHVTAVTVAVKNKMDLAIGVAVGSSIQIALFVTPLVVLIGWMAEKEMSLYFNIFETVSLFVTTFVVNFLILDGRSTYLEGVLLCACYIIIAICAFFYPGVANESTVGGGANGT